MKKPKSSQANETASSQVGDSAVPTEKPHTTSQNTAEEQTNSSQTTSAQSSKSKTTSKNSAKNKDFYTLSNRCENHIDFDPKAKDPSPEPHTKQVVRTSTNNVLSQQDAACASVTAQVAVSRECSLVLSKSPLSQALNRIYFPADVSGARHSANYYVYFEPASANHNQRPRLQKSNGRPEFNKLNDQLACVKLPLNEEKLKSLSSATQSTPPSQPSSSNSEHLSPLRALLISEEQLAKYHYDGVIYILPLDVIFAINQFHQIRSQLEVEFKSRHKGEQVSLGTLWNYFFDEYIVHAAGDCARKTKDKYSSGNFASNDPQMVLGLGSVLPRAPQSAEILDRRSFDASASSFVSLLDNGNALLTDTKPVSAISAAQRQELLKLVEKDCLIPLPRGNKEKIATRQMAILVHGYHSDDQWAEIYLQTQFTSWLKAHERDLDNCRTFLSVPKNPSEGKDTAESLSADIMDVVAQSCNAYIETDLAKRQQLLRSCLPSSIGIIIKLVELYGSLSEMGALHDELTQASATAKEISKAKSSPDPQLSAELLSHLHQAHAEAVTFLNGTTEIGAWIELAETHLHLSDTPADQELFALIQHSITLTQQLCSGTVFKQASSSEGCYQQTVCVLELVSNLVRSWSLVSDTQMQAIVANQVQQALTTEAAVLKTPFYEPNWHPLKYCSLAKLVFKALGKCESLLRIESLTDKLPCAKKIESLLVTAMSKSKTTGNDALQQEFSYLHDQVIALKASIEQEQDTAELELLLLFRLQGLQQSFMWQMQSSELPCNAYANCASILYVAQQIDTVLSLKPSKARKISLATGSVSLYEQVRRNVEQLRDASWPEADQKQLSSLVKNLTDLEKRAKKIAAAAKATPEPQVTSEHTVVSESQATSMSQDNLEQQSDAEPHSALESPASSEEVAASAIQAPDSAVSVETAVSTENAQEQSAAEPLAASESPASSEAVAVPAIQASESAISVETAVSTENAQEQSASEASAAQEPTAKNKKPQALNEPNFSSLIKKLGQQLESLRVCDWASHPLAYINHQLLVLQQVVHEIESQDPSQWQYFVLRLQRSIGSISALARNLSACTDRSLALSQSMESVEQKLKAFQVEPNVQLLAQLSSELRQAQSVAQELMGALQPKFSLQPQTAWLRALAIVQKHLTFLAAFPSSELPQSLLPDALASTQKLQVMAKVFCNEELELKLANIGKHLQLVFAGEESVSELQDYVLQVHSLAATLTSKQVKSQQSAHTLAHQQYLHLYDAQRKAHENYLASATSDKLVALCGSEWIAPHQEMLDCMEQAKHLLLLSDQQGVYYKYHLSFVSKLYAKAHQLKIFWLPKYDLCDKDRSDAQQKVQTLQHKLAHQQLSQENRATLQKDLDKAQTELNTANTKCNLMQPYKDQATTIEESAYDCFKQLYSALVNRKVLVIKTLGSGQGTELTDILAYNCAYLTAGECQRRLALSQDRAIAELKGLIGEQSKARGNQRSAFIKARDGIQQYAHWVVEAAWQKSEIAKLRRKQLQAEGKQAQVPDLEHDTDLKQFLDQKKKQIHADTKEQEEKIARALKDCACRKPKIKPYRTDKLLKCSFFAEYSYPRNFRVFTGHDNKAGTHAVIDPDQPATPSSATKHLCELIACAFGSDGLLHPVHIPIESNIKGSTKLWRELKDRDGKLDIKHIALVYKTVRTNKHRMIKRLVVVSCMAGLPPIVSSQLKQAFAEHKIDMDSAEQMAQWRQRRVGIDIGTQTISVSGQDGQKHYVYYWDLWLFDGGAVLQKKWERLKNKHKDAQDKYSQHMRELNPQMYDANGKRLSKAVLKTLRGTCKGVRDKKGFRLLNEVRKWARKLAIFRKEIHMKIACRIAALGGTVVVEKMSFSGLAKRGERKNSDPNSQALTTPKAEAAQDETEALQTQNQTQGGTEEQSAANSSTVGKVSDATESVSGQGSLPANTPQAELKPSSSIAAETPQQGSQQDLTDQSKQDQAQTKQPEAKTFSRAGKSIQNAAPAAFLGMLAWILKKLGGQLIKAPTQVIAATQRNPLLPSSDPRAFTKLPGGLSQRFKPVIVPVMKGDEVVREDVLELQRDFIAAFTLQHLTYNPELETKQKGKEKPIFNDVDVEACRRDFPAFLKAYEAAMRHLLVKGLCSENVKRNLQPNELKLKTKD